MKYYLGNYGQQSGPFELNELIYNGLTPQSLVWCETMTNWANAMQVPEVAALLQPQMPPQQPQQQYGYPNAGQPAGAYPAQSKEVGFTDALKICFSKYVTFSGRARRSEFWWFYLWRIFFGCCTCGLSDFVFLIPSIAVTFRRLHDTGRSGWWWGAGIIAILFGLPTIGPAVYMAFVQRSHMDIISAIGFCIFLYGIAIFVWAITLLVFCLKDSQPGDNKYGPSPKY